MNSKAAPKIDARKIRVAVFNTHPIQYYAPIWRKLSGFSDLDATVFYGTDFSVRGYRDKEFGVDISWDVPLLEGYASEFLKGSENINRAGFWKPRPGPAASAIFSNRPDVVVVTAYHAAFWYGILAAAAAVGSRVVMRHDATDEAFASRGLKKLVRGMILRVVYRSVSRFAVVGARARHHLKTYGVTDARMTRSPFCVDSEWIVSQQKQWLPKRPVLRAEFGIGADEVAFLFSGKLIPKKDPLSILQAIAQMPQPLKNRVHLLVAGDGILGSELELLGRKILGERLHMMGFLNQAELGRAYAMADALILPSLRGAGETWGLVVNEALEWGLPAVVSDGVGCHEDLVPDETTGRVFRAGEAGDLAKALESLLAELPLERTRYQEACLARVAGYSLDAAAAGLREAIIAACK